MYNSLAIVVPLYNETTRITRCLEQCLPFMDELESQGWHVKLILSNDGSQDNTHQLALDAQANDSRLEVANIDHAGKGAALRAGAKLINGECLTLLTDCDISTPLSEWTKLLHSINEGACIAIGSRALASSLIETPQPWYRRILGRLANGLIRFVLNLPLHDTQCGFKLLTPKALTYLTATESDGFAYDFEMLHLAHREGQKIAEVGVRWHHDHDSRVHSIYYLLTLGSLFSVRYKTKC